MSSFCLSSAPILRCVPLTRYQSIVIIVPTAIEVLFTSSLVIAQWNSGHRRHLLLTAEGWIYLFLSILELLTHVMESAQGNVDIFAGLDVTTGVASFLPLFFYCFFLYIYSDSELLPNAVSLPKKLGKVASLLLLILIPAIVGVNEIASFVGIERRLDFGTPPQVIIGFSSQRNWTLNLFFSSLSLALMTVFQAVVFMITAFRLVVAVINQRRFDNLGQDAVHMINGMGWLSAGMKLGAIESTVGFAGGDFGIVLARRILRLLARACLCIGIVKGVDEIQDFRAIRQEMADAKAGYAKSGGNARNLKALISNPRLSAFQHVSTTNAAGHLLTNPTFDFNRDSRVPRTMAQTKKSPVTPEAQLRSLQEVAGITTFENLGKSKGSISSSTGSIGGQGRKERVTIYRQSNGAPTLQLRLSMADFPSPKFAGESSSERPRSWLPPPGKYLNRNNWDAGYGPSYATSPDNPFSTEKEIADSLRETGTLAPPRHPFGSDPEKGPRDSVAQSFSGSVAEIVIAPQRTLSQSTARALLYRASSTTNKSKPESDVTAHPLPTNKPSSEKSEKRESYGPLSPQPVGGDAEATPKAAAPVPLSPSEYGSPNPEDPSKFRIVSDYSFHSLPDTLQAVRELAREFPGPPVTYNGRPVMGNLPPVSAWNGSPITPSFFSKSARSSIMANAYGSLSEVNNGKGSASSAKPSKRRSALPLSLTRSGKAMDDEENRIEGNGRYEPRPVIMPYPTPSPTASAPATGGNVRPKIFISDEILPGVNGSPAPISRFLQAKPSMMSVQTSKSIDPFDDSQSVASSPATPTATSTVKQIISRPTLLRPHPSRLDMSALQPNHPVSVPTSPENITPLSSYTVTMPGGNGNSGSQADPFNELAVRTGASSDMRKSGRWKYDSTASTMLPSPPEKAFAPGDGLPTTPVRFSAIGMPMPLQPRSRFSMLGAPPASPNGKEVKRRSPSNITWLPQNAKIPIESPKRSTHTQEKEKVVKSEETENQGASLQRKVSDPTEAHRRQESIDAAAHLLSNSIPWLKNPDIEEEERKLRDAISATTVSAPRPTKISRVKTVGSVAMRATPKHTTGPMRRSLRVEPIMIPPPEESYAQMLEVTQEGGDDNAVVTDSAVTVTEAKARVYS